MRIDEFKRKWEAIPKEPDSFQFVEVGSKYNMFMGRNQELKKEFRIITNFEPANIETSSAYDVKVFIRDTKWNISIALLNDSYDEVFLLLLWDLYECAQSSPDENFAVRKIAQRVHKWKKLFAKLSEIMSDERIRGLMGELFFLNEFVLPKAEKINAINSWRGPLGEDQDFISKEFWYEIKSTRFGSEKISVSSIEQLDNKNEGKLVIIEMDDGAIDDIRSISIAEIVRNIRSNLADCEEAIIEFNRKLLLYGYKDQPEYELKRFIIKRIRFYDVTDNFPRYLRSCTRNEVINLTYILSISTLEEWFSGVQYEY